MPTFGTVSIGKVRANAVTGQRAALLQEDAGYIPARSAGTSREAGARRGRGDPGDPAQAHCGDRNAGLELGGPAYCRGRLLLAVGGPATRQAPQGPVRVVPPLRGLTHQPSGARSRTLVGASGGPAILAAFRGRQYQRLPTVVPPKLRHVQATQPVCVVVEPVGQPGHAGRRSFGCQQPSHESDNLVAGERHVSHQQADHLGQGEAHRRGGGCGEQSGS